MFLRGVLAVVKCLATYSAD